MATSMAKPKYYLGEDPYLSIYGKENKYDGTQRAQRYQQRRQRSEDVDVYNPNRYVTLYSIFFVQLIAVYNLIFNFDNKTRAQIQVA